MSYSFGKLHDFNFSTFQYRYRHIIVTKLIYSILVFFVRLMNKQLADINRN